VNVVDLDFVPVPVWNVCHPGVIRIWVSASWVIPVTPSLFVVPVPYRLVVRIWIRWRFCGAGSWSVVELVSAHGGPPLHDLGRLRLSTVQDSG
jgi:hypothetical protein